MASSSSPAFGWAVAAFWGLGRGTGERARGLECGGSPGVEAHERRGNRGSFPSLPRRRRGGGRGVGRGGVAREGGLQCGWEWGQGVVGVPHVAVGSRRWPPGLPKRRRRCSAPAAEEAERERGGRRQLDWFAISEKFRGPTIQQK